MGQDSPPASPGVGPRLTSMSPRGAVASYPQPSSPRQGGRRPPVLFYAAAALLLFLGGASMSVLHNRASSSSSSSGRDDGDVPLLESSLRRIKQLEDEAASMKSAMNDLRGVVDASGNTRRRENEGGKGVHGHGGATAVESESMKADKASSASATERNANADAATNNERWDSSKSAVMGLAYGYGLNVFEMFVGSLRATGFNGAIILGIAPDAPRDVKEYLAKRNVTTHDVTMAEKCTYYGQPTFEGKPSAYKKCAAAYPEYKVQWGRFPLTADWLRECKECTDGVMLTDIRDAYFQSDPFQAANIMAAAQSSQSAPPPLMVFQEHPDVTATHWLTTSAVHRCKKDFRFTKEQPMLCSGSTMGNRDGILAYLDAMKAEFDLWNAEEQCRSDVIYDDQSIHDYLWYSGGLKHIKGAKSIPHRTGPIHVVGWQADLIFRAAIKKHAKEDKDKIGGGGDVTKEDLAQAEGWVNSHRMHGTDEDNWRDWLPPEHELTDRKTGHVTNLDGSASAQVHQFDRFGRAFKTFWLDRMVKEWNEKLDSDVEKE